jgi:hypothetical protein
MDLRPDVVDLLKEESDEESYEPGWYTILRETAEAAATPDTTEARTT